MEGRHACACFRRGQSSGGVKPVAEQRGRAAGAEDGDGQQEGAVAAAVVVPGRVLVVHDQACHVGRRLHIPVTAQSLPRSGLHASPALPLRLMHGISERARQPQADAVAGDTPSAASSQAVSGM